MTQMCLSLFTIEILINMIQDIVYPDYYSTLFSVPIWNSLTLKNKHIWAASDSIQHPILNLLWPLNLTDISNQNKLYICAYMQKIHFLHISTNVFCTNSWTSISFPIQSKRLRTKMKTLLQYNFIHYLN